MNAKGTYRNGTIVLKEPPSSLEDGTELDVQMRVADNSADPFEPDLSTQYACRLHEWFKTLKPMSPEASQSWRRAMNEVEETRNDDPHRQAEADAAMAAWMEERD